VTQQHGLTWGALDFVDPNPTADGYLLEAIGEETKFGNPKAEIQVVRSLLTDGSLAVLEGWDNREVPIRVRISAPEATAGPALAAAESALMAEIQATSKSPLIYTPAATDAAVCVFDVVAATLERDTQGEWDKEEALWEYRYFTLTLTCLPFARPEDTVVVPAIPVPPTPGSPTTIDIDTCTSAAGWSYNGSQNILTGSLVALASSGGSVNGSGTVHYYNGSLPGYVVRRPGTLSMGATPYLKITATLTGGPTPRMGIVGFTSFDEAVAIAPSTLVVGATDFYFLPNTALTNLDMYVFAGTGIAEGATLSSQIHNIARTDSLPSIGSTRQQARQTTVAGSAPTQAAIRLFDATPAALGTEILVHSSRNTAWQPALRPYRTTSATVTTDSAMVSGGRNTLTSSMVFRIAASKFTEGTYSLMARMSVSTSAALGWSVRMVSSAGAATVGSSVVVSGSVTVPVTTGYQVLNLAAIPLPVVKAEADQMVELTLTGTANMTVDEAWLFGLHDGVLTWIRDADSLTWIEIRSPELGAARPSIYGGTGAKGANSIDVSWKAAGSTYGSFGSHRFEPGLMQIFTVTSTSLVSQSEIEFYPRYHSHVEEA
jgi:hypothetical protein